MSCLSICASNIDKNIEVDVFKGNADIDISCKCLEKRISISCSLICTVVKNSYLNVSPNHIWLTPDMLSSGKFDIISNVDWNIV